MSWSNFQIMPFFKLNFSNTSDLKNGYEEELYDIDCFRHRPSWLYFHFTQNFKHLEDKHNLKMIIILFFFKYKWIFNYLKDKSNTLNLNTDCTQQVLPMCHQGPKSNINATKGVETFGLIDSLACPYW